MKQILIILLGALYSGISHSQINPNPSASLDAYILNEMNLENFPGVSTIIVKDGETSHSPQPGRSGINPFVLCLSMGDECGSLPRATPTAGGYQEAQ